MQEAQAKNQTLIGLVQKDPEVEDPKPADFLPIGIEMAVGRLLSMPDGSSSALVQGRRRVEIVDFVRTRPYLKVRARPIFESQTADRQTQALMRSVLDLFDRCVQLDRSIPEEAHLFALNISEPGWLADMIATSLVPELRCPAGPAHPARAACASAGDQQDPRAGSRCAGAGG